MPDLFSRVRVFAFLVLGFGLALSAQAQTVPALQSEDTFAYAAGSVLGQSGGTGWSGAWINPYAPNGVPLVVNGSGQLTFAAGGSTIESAARSLTTRYSAGVATESIPASC